MTPVLHQSITCEGDTFVVDAALVASRFGLSVAAFREDMRRGAIVAICEQGVETDQGRFRLTFRRGALLWRFVLDQDGTLTEDPVLATVSRRTQSELGP